MGLIARIKDRLFDRRNVIEIESLEEGGQPLSLESLKNTTIYRHILVLPNHVKPAVDGTDFDLVSGTLAKATQFPQINYVSKNIIIYTTSSDNLTGKKLSEINMGFSQLMRCSFGTNTYEVIQHSVRVIGSDTSKKYMRLLCKTETSSGLKLFYIDTIYTDSQGDHTMDTIYRDTVTKV